MYQDVECPYCEHNQDINHDDGYGYEEDKIHNQECDGCGKTFIYTTAIIYSYHAEKADCLNGGKHVWEKIHGYPEEYFINKRRCSICGDEKEL